MSRSRAGSLQQRLQQEYRAERRGLITTTVLHGRRALRVNVNSFLMNAVTSMIW